MLGEIYQDDCNLAVWQRSVAPEITHYLQALTEIGRKIYLRALVEPDEGLVEDLQALVGRSLPKLVDHDAGRTLLLANVVELIEMYACLFETKQVGVRMASLEKAMCPKFHVDFLPARMVTCFSGAGTQWLSEPAEGEKRVPDNEPVVFNQINTGDVALLKGDGWFNNEGFGIVHRSPPVAEGETRVFLSLDFVD
ncbi:MAG: DUF1826 domain-containing protein [Pontibacterium sp.]